MHFEFCCQLKDRESSAFRFKLHVYINVHSARHTRYVNVLHNESIEMCLVSESGFILSVKNILVKQYHRHSTEE